MMALAVMALSLAGLALLSLSMHKHHRDLFGTPPTPWRTWTLRAAGWTLLGLSVGACVIGWGVSVGVVLWIGMLTAAASAVTAGLSWWCSRRRFSARTGRPPTRRSRTADVDCRGTRFGVDHPGH